jgi:hypothetical protein
MSKHPLKTKESKKDPNFDQSRISKLPFALYVTRIPGTVTLEELVA